MPKPDPLSWIDITVPLKNGLVHWPGDPDVTLTRVRDQEDGESNTSTSVSMSLHTGTHVDAPLHFIRRGESIDRMPLDITVGRARVIEVQDNECLTVEELKAHNLAAGERLLFRTNNSSRGWSEKEFFEDYVYVSPEAAAYLAEVKPRMVGIDYLSVGGFKRGGVETHQILLGAGIWVVEGLDLSAVSPGEYELVCLPLKVLGADGAPARAMVRPA